MSLPDGSHFSQFLQVMADSSKGTDIISNCSMLAGVKEFAWWSC